MNVSRPLRAALFSYECLRLLLLIGFSLVASLESQANWAFFPALAYLSANSLFPLMTLFIWIRPEEYRNYISLYISGKIIAAVSFFAWEIFSLREFPGSGNITNSLLILGGSVFINLTDILSVWGAWVLKNKLRKGGSSRPSRKDDLETSAGEEIPRQIPRQLPADLFENGGA